MQRDTTVFLLLRWIVGPMHWHYTSTAPCSATSCQQWQQFQTKQPQVAALIWQKIHLLKLCPLEYLFGLLKILPPCTWIKINQTKSALILALFQLHFGFFTVVPVLERKGSWGWNNNWKFRLLCVLEGKNVMCWRVGAACIFLKPKNVCSPSPVHWAPSQHGRAMGRERLAPWWHRWDRGWWPPGTCCCHLSGCTWHRSKAIFIAGLGGISITAP